LHPFLHLILTKKERIQVSDNFRCMRNAKLEMLNPKQILNAKLEITQPIFISLWIYSFEFRVWDFRGISTLGFRIFWVPVARKNTNLFAKINVRKVRTKVSVQVRTRQSWLIGDWRLADCHAKQRLNYRASVLNEQIMASRPTRAHSPGFLSRGGTGAVVSDPSLRLG